MSFRIKDQRNIYTKAVMLLIRQVLVAFWPVRDWVLWCIVLEVTGRLRLEISSAQEEESSRAGLGTGRTPSPPESPVFSKQARPPA